MDLLIRGNPSDIETLVIKNLKNIASRGFYACGSSNTITGSMPLENVKAMVKTVQKYGRYPISL